MAAKSTPNSIQTDSRGAGNVAESPTGSSAAVDENVCKHLAAVDEGREITSHKIDHEPKQANEKSCHKKKRGAKKGQEDSEKGDSQEAVADAGADQRGPEGLDDGEARLDNSKKKGAKVRARGLGKAQEFNKSRKAHEEVANAMVNRQESGELDDDEVQQNEGTGLSGKKLRDWKRAQEFKKRRKGRDEIANAVANQQEPGELDDDEAERDKGRKRTDHRRKQKTSRYSLKRCACSILTPLSAVPESPVLCFSVLELKDWKKLVQKTGRVVAIAERRHSMIAAGQLKMFQDNNPNYALFSPNDSRQVVSQPP